MSIDLSELQRRGESLRERRAGAMRTEYIHESDPHTPRIGYFVYPVHDIQDRKWMKFVERLRSHCTIRQVSPDDIKHKGMLEKCDVLFVGGGYPVMHSEALGADGIAKVRTWLSKRSDRGIVGCCAGAYCCMRDNPQIRDFNPHAWELLPDVDIVLDNVALNPFDWQFGQGDSAVRLTEEGKTMLGHEFSTCTTMYRNGPWMTIIPTDNVPDYEACDFAPSVAWGHFTSAVSNTKTRNNDGMVGSVAVLQGWMDNNRKNGRVILWSGHPEFSSFDLVPLLLRCFQHASSKEIQGTVRPGDNEQI